MASNTGCRSTGERLMTLKHLGGRGLLLQRFGKLVACAPAQLVEQPRILDRDHGLVGEGLDQLDLLVGERPHLRARQMTMTPIGSPSRNIGTPSMCDAAIAAQLSADRRRGSTPDRRAGRQHERPCAFERARPMTGPRRRSESVPIAIAP